MSPHPTRKVCHPPPKVRPLPCGTRSVAFRALGPALGPLAPPPAVLRGDATRQWRWQNLRVSMAHALIAGPSALGCLIFFPEVLTDLTSYTLPMNVLLAISTGYFLQDTLDIVWSGQVKASWEFLFHHALVLSCFGYSLLTLQYVAGTTVALLVEVNSVFLHARLLMKLAGANAGCSRAYRLNRYLNAFTYVIFRLGAQAYLTVYVIVQWQLLMHPLFFCIVLNLMNIIMLIYFYRLLLTDFCPRLKQCNNNKFVSD
ncbi:TLC domain-containing protein 1-like isoform X1 [Lampetra planeri]